MKQTAVEWLGNEITSRITRRNPHDTIIIQTQGEILIELIEQAIKMEKEQIIKSAQDNFYAGQDLENGYKLDWNSAEDYYKKNFK